MARVNSRRMNELRQEFFQAGKTQDADPATRAAADCWICGQRIDYDQAPGTGEDSHELDHYYPVSTHPQLQEDPANFRHAHRVCNRQRGNKNVKPVTGELVPDWF